MVIQAGGLGTILEQPNAFGGWTGGFWALFFPSLMAMIAFWSTLSLNMPDFTRFGRSQRDQAVGQVLGLPTTMTLFAILAVITASATAIVYGEAIFNPVDLAARFDSPIFNLVSPSYDFSNTFPKLISFRTGGIITAIIGILIQPWYLFSTPEIYIFTWLGFYGGATGAIAGVLIADYWVIRRTDLRLADLFRTDGGAYRYAAGWNWRAVVALAVGIFLAVGGAYSATAADGSATGPFPAAGLLSFLKIELPWGGFLYDYNWVVGLLVAFILYWILATFFPQPQEVPAEASAPAPGMA
jgi:NCS1 family nucleobase:cation symporter-1